MITPASSPTVLPGGVAFRALARALAHLEDFDRFVGGLESALGRVPHFETMKITLERDLGGASPPFSSASLTMPLTGARGTLGTLQASPAADRRQFTSADLHLLAGLADFLSAALTQAQRLQDAGRARELLRLLLNQAPVGIAAFGPDRHPLVANDLAARWLGEVPPPFEEIERGAGGFHLRAGGKLIYGEARRTGPQPEADWLVVLHDLSAEQVRLLELMKRDAYRALAEGARFGFALVEGAQVRDGVLRRLDALRGALNPGEAVGPYDAHRIGLVLPGLGGLALRARLRELRPFLGDAAGLRAGYAEIGRDGRTPEGLLEAALRRYGAYDELLRPALLVQDENPAVTEAFALVLGREVRVVQSASADQTRALLGREDFELLVAELEPRNGPAGTELVTEACALQPGLRPLLTTMGSPVGRLPEDAAVVEKPFNAESLRALIRQRLER